MSSVDCQNIGQAKSRNRAPQPFSDSISEFMWFSFARDEEIIFWPSSGL